MLECKENETENTKDAILCGKSEKIDLDVPSQDLTLTFNYDKFEKTAKEQNKEKNSTKDISSFLSVQEGSRSLLEQKKAVQKQIDIFKRTNGDLAADGRFSDTYYFRLAEFYSLIKDFQSESECLSHIKNTENPEYALKIAQNRLALFENEKENIALLYNMNTAESARKLSAWYLAKNDFDKAEDALCRYINLHDEIPYHIYFQYAFLFMKKGNASKAIHYFRRSFYTQNTASAAVLLSMLYLVGATKNQKLLKKAFYWNDIAVHLDISFIPALRLYINLQLESGPEKTEKILSKYLSLNTARKDGFYFDAAVNYAKCAFVREKYGEALERLQDLVQDRTNPAAVWNNIALCNAGMKKFDRAERNIAKSLEKFREQEHTTSRQLEIILTNYMHILNAQGKYAQTLSLFEKANGEKNFDLSEENYTGYFTEYRKALIAAGDYETYFDFLTSVFLLDSNSKNLKRLVCNDILRMATVTGRKTPLAYKCLDSLKGIHKEDPRGRHTGQTVNNIVFASLELGVPIPPDILKDFTSIVGMHPCYTATYGLYLLRVKHDRERGLSYYDKAVEQSQKNGEFYYLTEELKLKRDIEEARALLESGGTAAARRLLERLSKRVERTLQGYRQNVARLLAEC